MKFIMRQFLALHNFSKIIFSKITVVYDLCKLLILQRRDRLQIAENNVKGKTIAHDII